MLIPRLRPAFNHKELFAACAWWRGGVPEFEKAFEKKFSVSHAIAFSYGRTGLYALLKAMGLQGDEVICPAYTCVVVPHAIVISGNKSVFIDCAENDFNMDLDELKRAITPKTKAIIVTHLFGYPMDCDRIQEIVSKWDHKIYVIHDCAHSFGATWNGKYVWEYGDAAFFGLGIGKLISSLYGGMVSTNDSQISSALMKERERFEKGRKRLFLKSLGRLFYLSSVMVGFHPRVYSLVKWVATHTKFLKGWTDYYREDQIEFPKDAFDPMLGIEGRLGVVQLGKYDHILATRRAAASYIEGELQSSLYKYPLKSAGATYSHFPVVVDNKNSYFDSYRRKRVELGELIEYSVPHMAAYRSLAGTDCGRSKYLAEHTINIPIWHGVSMKKLRSTVEGVCRKGSMI